MSSDASAGPFAPAPDAWVLDEILRMDPVLRAAWASVEAAPAALGTAERQRAVAGLGAALRDDPRYTALVALGAWPIHTFPVVQWGDLDSFGHVNNVVYFRWFESARIACFEAIGFNSHAGVGPILAETKCSYRAQLFFPDHVAVGVRIARLDERSFTMEFALYSQEAGKLAAFGEALVFAYDYQAKARAAIPDAVAARIRARFG